VFGLNDILVSTEHNGMAAIKKRKRQCVRKQNQTGRTAGRELKLISFKDLSQSKIAGLS
jgi:hypothetical protein